MSTARGGAGGSIVNVSSAAATLGSPHEYVHYAAAKAGIDAMTVGLAKELADQGVRVNGVAPGMVRTGIHAAAGDPDRLERVVERIPMGRVAEPIDVVSAIAWLLGIGGRIRDWCHHSRGRRPLNFPAPEPRTGATLGSLLDGRTSPTQTGPGASAERPGDCRVRPGTTREARWRSARWRSGPRMGPAPRL